MTRRPLVPPIAPGEAHLWLFNFDPFPDFPEGWERFLSAEETARAKRFIAEADRLRFMMRRGILRQLLGAYCGLDPADISYEAKPDGKLYLPDNPLAFNLSKSRDWVAIVVTWEKAAGVDIEQVRPLPDLPLLAKRWFSPEERSGLAALPQGVQLDAFYHTWTQKEAYIKAQGKGLRLPLADFSVSVNPGEPGRIVSIKDFSDDLHAWKIACFKPGVDCHTAVCIRAEKDIDIHLITTDTADFISRVSSGNKALSV